MGGGLLTLWPAVGTTDGQAVLVPAANDLRVYHASTGKLLRRLSGHLKLVTCAARYHKNRYKVKSPAIVRVLCRSEPARTASPARVPAAYNYAI
jgi:hypothetical protein